MDEFAGKVCVVTGGASGLGRAMADEALARGMKLVLADVDEAGLAAARAELSAAGGQVIAARTDVSKAAEVEALADAAASAFGDVHLLFNNAGVGTGGLIWESSARDWEWVLGVNVMGVAHGVRVFTPRMLAHGGEGHIVNTASVAGLVSPPTMGVYNASKHAVVALSESLHHDLRLVGAKVGASVLCPAFVPTRIDDAERARPAALQNDGPETTSQRAAREALGKAVSSGKVSARQVAALTFEAVQARRFWIHSHPAILGSVERRTRELIEGVDPTDPFSHGARGAARSTAS